MEELGGGGGGEAEGSMNEGLEIWLLCLFGINHKVTRLHIIEDTSTNN